MDKETAKELIALIDNKIAVLEKSKAEIRSLVEKEKSQIDLPIADDSSGIPFNGSSEKTKQVYKAVLSMGKSVSPKEIFAHLKNEGIDIPDARVRQILMRWKGRLFRSHTRGLWKAIKYE